MGSVLAALFPDKNLEKRRIGERGGGGGAADAAFGPQAESPETHSMLEREVPFWLLAPSCGGGGVSAITDTPEPLRSNRLPGRVPVLFLDRSCYMYRLHLISFHINMTTLKIHVLCYVHYIQPHSWGSVPLVSENYSHWLKAPQWGGGEEMGREGEGCLESSQASPTVLLWYQAEAGTEVWGVAGRGTGLGEEAPSCKTAPLPFGEPGENVGGGQLPETWKGEPSLPAP